MKSTVNEILASFRDYVENHRYRETPILTAYVNVDPTDENNRKERPAWKIALKNEITRLSEAIDPDELRRRETQRKWANTEGMVTDYLSWRKPEGRSVALFTDHNDYVAIDLPIPVETRLYYGVPQIKPMLFALDQYKQYDVVLVSGADARIVRVFLTRTTGELRIETEHEPGREKEGRYFRRLGRFSATPAKERRDAELERRFASEVADAVNRQFQVEPCERLVLGGNLKQAHAVKNLLHPAAREKLVAVETIDFKLPDADLGKVVKAIAEQHEAEHDLAVVEDLVSRFNRGRTAVLEEQGVVSALERRNIKRLVLPYPIDVEKFDALIVDATISGAEVEFVLGPAAERLQEFGGIGADLFYSER